MKYQWLLMKISSMLERNQGRHPCCRSGIDKISMAFEGDLIRWWSMFGPFGKTFPENGTGGKGVIASNSPASAFRTSASDKANCRPICFGLTPALKAARTAFSLLVVRAVPIVCARCFRDGSSTTGALVPPRRCLSARAAAISRPSSSSVSCLIALDRSLGRTCRGDGVASDELRGRVDGEGRSRPDGVENRSGVTGGVRSSPME